jgi:hypothetical protein
MTGDALECSFAMCSSVSHELAVSNTFPPHFVTGGFLGHTSMGSDVYIGQLVYTEVDSHAWLLRLEKTAYEESKVTGPFLEVHCTYTDYDGQRHGQ